MRARAYKAATPDPSNARVPGSGTVGGGGGGGGGGWQLESLVFAVEVWQPPVPPAIGPPMGNGT